MKTYCIIMAMLLSTYVVFGIIYLVYKEHKKNITPWLGFGTFYGFVITTTTFAMMVIKKETIENMTLVYIIHEITFVLWIALPILFIFRIIENKKEKEKQKRMSKLINENKPRIP